MDFRFRSIKKFRLALAIAMTSAMMAASIGVSYADPNKHDIGSAGAPSITGSLGGSVTGSSSIQSDLEIFVNFGELSPINTNSTIKVVVPVAIRSTNEYQVSVSVAGTFGGGADAINASDIGFGIQNFRALGANTTACSANSIINPVFFNDPSTSVTVNPAIGRAAYPSSLATIGSSAVIINGPVLSIFQGVGNWRRDPDNGRAFDVILAVKPQWFQPGAFGVTLVLSISGGPNFPCN